MAKGRSRAYGSDLEHLHDALTVGSDNGAMFTVVVSNSAGSATSNPAMLTVPDKKSFEVMTGVGAVVAGIEDTSYAINNDTNALAATNIGRKRIELIAALQFCSTQAPFVARAPQLPVSSLQGRSTTAPFPWHLVLC